MKVIPLVGKYSHLVTLVDDEDYELASQYRWQHFKNGLGIYARNLGRPTNGKRPSMLLHSLLTGWPLVDHRNHDGLDNRRQNLRQATPAQNQRNKTKYAVRAGRPTCSRFKGVYWRAQAGKWAAQIGVDGERHHLGCFLDEEDAARAYDRAALLYYGEWACLNFPEEVPN